MMQPNKESQLLTSQKLIVITGVIFEFALATVAIVWGLARSIELTIHLDWGVIKDGLLAAMPLLAVNYLIFQLAGRKSSPPNVFKTFREEIVVPFCSTLDYRGIFVLALVSGVAEELFFRGILDSELTKLMGLPTGLIAANILFAYIHLIGNAHRFFPVLIVYILFGLYLSWLAQQWGTLTVPIIAHGVHNVLAMLYLRYCGEANQHPASASSDCHPQPPL